MCDLEESRGCYFAKNPDCITIQTDKTLYVYLEGMLTMCPQAIFVDKFGVKYKIMEQRLALSVNWKEFPVPDLAPKTASSMGGDRVSHENSQTRNAKEFSSAPPMHSTFESRRVEPSAREVPSRPTTSFKPIHTRGTEPRAEGSGHFSKKTSFDHRRVRLANF